MSLVEISVFRPHEGSWLILWHFFALFVSSLSSCLTFARRSDKIVSAVLKLELNRSFGFKWTRSKTGFSPVSWQQQTTKGSVEFSLRTASCCQKTTPVTPPPQNKMNLQKKFNWFKISLQFFQILGN